MGRYAYGQTDFSGGEFSPYMYGRTDDPKYKKAVQLLENYIPTKEGPVIRRGGTVRATTVKDSSKPPVLIPFTFSDSQSFMLEFGDQYIRFYTNNAQLVVASGGASPWSGTFIANQATDTERLSVVYATIGATDNAYAILSGYAANSGTALSAGVPYTLVSPYLVADVPLIRWAQKGDVLYLAHPSYPPFKLERISAQSWVLQQVNLQDGPYLPINSYADAYISDSLSVQIRVQSANSKVNSFYTDPFFSVASVTSSGGKVLITTSAGHSYVTGQKIFISGTGTNADNYYIDNTGTPQNTTTPAYWVIIYESATTFLINQTYSSGSTGAGSTNPALFGPELEAFRNDNTVGIASSGRNIAVIMDGFRYYGTIDGGTTGTYLGVKDAAHANVIFANPDSNLTAGDATAWFLGEYSGQMPGVSLINDLITIGTPYGNGYPGCVTFHQDRLSFSGCPNSPTTLDMSTTAEYENFSVSPPTGATALQVVDSNAIGYALLSKDQNAVAWLTSTAHGLVAGTASGQFLITPSANGEALTPSNFNSNWMSYFGSANINAVNLDNAIIYVEQGGRRVRELLYNFFIGTFRPTDLTDAYEHITAPSVTKIVIAKQRQPLMWALKSDGTLASMTYDQASAGGFGEQTTNSGWARHVLGGRSDVAGTPPVVTSIAVIRDPTDSFDQLWLIVKRYNVGTTSIEYSIEYMSDIFTDITRQDDAYLCDGGVTYYSPKEISSVTTASPGVFTATAHGFSNGDTVKIVGVIGITDSNNNSLLNEKTFLVASKTTNTFELTDMSGNLINTTNSTSYVSGGEVAKLVSTLSGATWLEYQNVGLLLDGSICADVTVSSSGVITLPYPAAKIQVGFRFSSQMQTLRIEGGAQDGTSFGKLRRTFQYAIQLYQSGAMKIGTTFDNLFDTIFYQSNQNTANVAPPLFSGFHRSGVSGAYDFDSTICIEQDNMLPGMIQSLTTWQEEMDA